MSDYVLWYEQLGMKEVFASLFNDRAVALSAGIQRMVRSDIASSGVMFSIDKESGFDNVVFITSDDGLGETVVQGSVKPTLEAVRPAVLHLTLGSKAIKKVNADDTTTAG